MTSRSGCRCRSTRMLCVDCAFEEDQKVPKCPTCGETERKLLTTCDTCNKRICPTCSEACQMGGCGWRSCTNCADENDFCPYHVKERQFKKGITRFQKTLCTVCKKKFNGTSCHGCIAIVCNDCSIPRTRVKGTRYCHQCAADFANSDGENDY